MFCEQSSICDQQRPINIFSPEFLKQQTALIKWKTWIPEVTRNGLLIKRQFRALFSRNDYTHSMAQSITQLNVTIGSLAGDISNDSCRVMKIVENSDVQERMLGIVYSHIKRLETKLSNHVVYYSSKEILNNVKFRMFWIKETGIKDVGTSKQAH